MQTILIVIHLLVVLALVGVVLLQRSEGGGLGIGGGSGFMTARGAANALTRATAFLAVAFFATSLSLSILARYGERPTDILDRVPQGGQQVPSGRWRARSARRLDATRRTGHACRSECACRRHPCAGRIGTHASVGCGAGGTSGPCRTPAGAKRTVSRQSKPRICCGAVTQGSPRARAPVTEGVRDRRSS
jgi:preprotein translocase subunit SecG